MTSAPVPAAPRPAGVPPGGTGASQGGQVLRAGRGRVLVVDNDPHFRRSLRVLLDAKGYAVFVASTPAEAKQIAAQERVHVAVLDIRLENDPDRDDTSGLELAKTLDPLVIKIMLSAYPSVEVVRSTFGDVSAFTFVDKEECPDKLLEELVKAFAEEVKLNFDLSISWQGISLEEVTREIEVEDGLSPAVLEAEVEEALAKLFYEADEILVTPLVPADRARSTMGSGAVVVTVQPRYRGSGWGAPMVVKLAGRDKIIVEAGNYEQYVGRFIAGFRHTGLHQQVQTHLLGGIVYTLVGTPFEECVDLGTFYAQHSASEVVTVLKRLFLETCRHWYANREARQVRDLVKLYTRPLKLSPERLEVTLREAGLSDWIDANEAQQRIPGLEGPFVNPIEWLRLHPSLLTQVSLCYTHGDMHSRNVLVDRNHQAWMIDFYRTGSGHMLRDLIELESDVKFTLLDVTDLPSLVRFETALLSVKDYSGTPTLPRFQQPELQKAFFVVVGIRQIAARLADPGGDMLDYYQGLLLQSLAVIRMRHITPLKKCHAYLAAALLCGWLEE